MQTAFIILNGGQPRSTPKGRGIRLLWRDIDEHSLRPGAAHEAARQPLRIHRHGRQHPAQGDDPGHGGDGPSCAAWPRSSPAGKRSPTSLPSGARTRSNPCFSRTTCRSPPRRRRCVLFPSLKLGNNTHLVEKVCLLADFFDKLDPRRHLPAGIFCPMGPDILPGRRPAHKFPPRRPVPRSGNAMAHR